jgi:hypothetical protein
VEQYKTSMTDRTCVVILQTWIASEAAFPSCFKEIVIHYYPNNLRKSIIPHVPKRLQALVSIYKLEVIYI